MLKTILLFVLSLPALAQVTRLSTAIGYAPTGGLNNANTTLNSANTWAATSFIGNGKTLSAVRVNVSSVTGAVDGTELSLRVCGDSGGAPNTSSCSTAVTQAAGALSAGLKDFTGLSVSTTFGTSYWILLKNLNATPASNYPTIRTMGSASGPWNGTLAYSHGWRLRITTDGGSSWSTFASGADTVGIRRLYSDGTYEGLMLTGQSSNLYRAYGGTQIGVSIVAPASGTLAGISMMVQKTGTPTGALSYSIYAGSSTTPLATTYSVPASELYPSQGYVPLFFSSGVAVTAGATYHIVLANSASDSSTNCYSFYGASLDSDANSQALRPFGIQASSLTSGVWTDSATTVASMMLLYSSLFSGGGGTVTHAYTF